MASPNLGDENRAKIRDYIVDHPTAKPPAIAVALGLSKPTVYAHLRAIAEEGDTVPANKRVTRVADSDLDEGGASAETDDDVEYLRARNAELTEHVVDMSIELVRLQRLLRAQQEG